MTNRTSVDHVHILLQTHFACVTNEELDKLGSAVFIREPFMRTLMTKECLDNDTIQSDVVVAVVKVCLLVALSIFFVF